MRKHLILLAGAVLALSAAATACDSAVAGVQARPADDGPPACPAKAPVQRSPRVQGPVRLVRGSPSVVTLCSYHHSRLIPSRFVLRGPALNGLTAVVDGASRVTGFYRHCDRPAARDAYSLALVFGYRSGPAKTLSVDFADCQLALVARGRSAAILAGPVQDDLYILAGLRQDSHGDRTPDLIGLTPGAAVARLKKAGFGFLVSFDGAVVDPRAPFGTVIFAAPPAGVRVGRFDNLIGVQLAVHHAPVCTPRQLKLNYLGGGPNGGEESGVIVLRDDSPRPCRLPGPVRLTGLNAEGAPVTKTVIGKVVTPSVLGPRAKERREQLPPAGTLAEEVGLDLRYRYVPGSHIGPCPAHHVVPAVWRFTLPGGEIVKIANSDPADPQKLVKSGGFVTCAGRFSLTGPVSYTG
jgi:hypothetical protein